MYPLASRASQRRFPMYPPPPVTKTRLLEAITLVTQARINRNKLPRELTHAHSIKAWLMCKWPLNLYTVTHTRTQSLWFPDSDMSAQWYFSQPVEKWKWNQSTELAQWILASYPGRSLNKQPGYEAEQILYYSMTFRSIFLECLHVVLHLLSASLWMVHLFSPLALHQSHP